MTLPTQKSRRVRRSLIAVAVAVLGAVAAAETIVVHSSIDVKADKNPFADAVESVTPNTSLTVLGREGGWVHVRTPAGKEGYVAGDDLQGTSDLSNISGVTKANSADASLAGRGLEDQTEAYAKSKNLSPKDAQQMVDWGNLIKQDEVAKFAKEGHVGPAKYRQ